MIPIYIDLFDWYHIQKASKLLMCTLISLLKQHFLLLTTFCTYFEICSNFELEAVWIFYVIVFQCKWVSEVDTYEAEIAVDSIIWKLFARKSAKSLNLRNSFVTISSTYTYYSAKAISMANLKGLLTQESVIHSLNLSSSYLWKESQTKKVLLKWLRKKKSSLLY